MPAVARDAIRSLRASSIREVANAGMGRTGILPFWFGEPDEVTPEFIRQAASDALTRGETFYVQNFGIPELRDTIASYVSRLHRPLAAENIVVTNSGMTALAIAEQALIDYGDRVVVVTPLWPNLVEGPKILGADVVTIALRFGADGWRLDLDQLPGVRAAVAPGAMYAFFRIDGLTDSLAFCKALIAAEGLGLAPGIAFGLEGEGFVRWCYGSSLERLADGIARLERFLRRR